MKFSGQGKKKQKCVHRVCVGMVSVNKGIYSIMLADSVCNFSILVQICQEGATSKLEKWRWFEWSSQVCPIQTTPELFSTLTAEVFVPKRIILKLDPQRMDFDPPMPPSYIPCVELLKASGRRPSTTTSDGNCLFHSLSKALLGRENFHYRIIICF